ncbi:MAG: hypothetical protein ABH812_04275 [bacterium]
MKLKIEKGMTLFFLSASIFISILLVEVIVLVLTNQFKIAFIYLALLPAFAVGMFFFTHLKKDIIFLPKISVPAIILIILVSFILIFYPHDSFGGSDESVYSNYATHLAQTSSLTIPLYLSNLPNKDAESARKYPPGYSVWLAAQQSFFGVQGLVRGNLILIILGIFSLFLVSSFIVGKTGALGTIILFSSSMPFLWFSRETLSENLSFYLLWSLILFLLVFLRTKHFIYLFITFFCSWLFGLTRIEGFFIQLLLCFIIPIILYFYKIANLKRIFIVMLVYFFLVISNIIIVKNTYFPFLKTMVAAVKYTTIINLKTINPNENILNFNTFSRTNIRDSNVTNNSLGAKSIQFYLLMLSKYNLLLVIFSIFLAFILFFYNRNKISHPKSYFFIIIAVILPELLKIISLNVTLAQPWLYRRYLYALLPFGYMSFFILLSQLKNKKVLIILASSLFIINLVFSSPIIFLKNNWFLIDKLNEITKDVSKNDFIIIKEKPIGEYYPASFLIINKGIRSSASSILWLHDFLPERKIFNNAPYNRIFLLSSEYNDINSSIRIVSQKLVDDLVYSYFKIASRKSIDIEYTQLVPSCLLNLLGEEEGLVDPYNIDLLPFSAATKYCSKPGNEIVHHEGMLYIYELVYNKI